MPSLKLMLSFLKQ